MTLGMLVMLKRVRLASKSYRVPRVVKQHMEGGILTEFVHFNIVSEVSTLQHIEVVDFKHPTSNEWLRDLDSSHEPLPTIPFIPLSYPQTGTIMFVQSLSLPRNQIVR
jgi:hypothetical protein